MLARQYFSLPCPIQNLEALDHDMGVVNTRQHLLLNLSAEYPPGQFPVTLGGTGFVGAAPCLFSQTNPRRLEQCSSFHLPGDTKMIIYQKLIATSIVHQLLILFTHKKIEVFQNFAMANSSYHEPWSCLNTSEFITDFKHLAIDIMEICLYKPFNYKSIVK